MGEKPPECFKSQVRGREAQVRLLPQARLLLSLGEHTQGRPPRRARKSCLWRALLSHVPCGAAEPRAREVGPCPAGSPSELPGRPRPHGNRAASLPTGAERPVRVCPHLAAQARQADAGPDAAGSHVKASAGSGRPPWAAAERMSAVRTLSATLVLRVPPGAQRTAPGPCHSSQAPKDAPPKSQQAAELPNKAVAMSALITKHSRNAPPIRARRLQRRRLLGHKSEAWG